MRMFSVRLVNADFYMENAINGLDVAYSEFRGAQISKVPVIRIFGSTPAGQKTCLHVHGVFPYFYIPYDGTQPKDRYFFTLACSLDKAINISLGAAEANVRHVHNIELVTKIPFYGYHRKAHQFMKICFYNPYTVKKAVELLQNGAVMSRCFQPYFAHIPYILQMFIDYNLYGMNMIQLSKVKFRRKRSLTTEVDAVASSPSSLKLPTLNISPGNKSSSVVWDPRNIPEDLLLDDTVLSKSTCYLEADCIETDILNKSDLAGMKMNPGIAFIWEDERQRRRQNGLDSQISLASSQSRNYVVATDSDELFLLRLKEKLLSIQNESLEAYVLESQSQENSGIEVEDLGQKPCVHNPDFSKEVLEDTLVDEEVVLSLSLTLSSTTASQSSAGPALDSSDMELAAILQDLASSQSSGGSLWLTQRSGVAASEGEEEEKESEDETLVWTQQDLQYQVENIATDIERSLLQDPWDWQNEDLIPQLDGPGDTPPKPKRKMKLCLSTKSKNAKPIDELKGGEPGLSDNIWKINPRKISVSDGVGAKHLIPTSNEILTVDTLPKKNYNLRRRVKLEAGKVSESKGAGGIGCKGDQRNCKIFGCVYHSPSKAKVLLTRVEDPNLATVSSMKNTLIPVLIGDNVVSPCKSEIPVKSRSGCDKLVVPDYWTRDENVEKFDENLCKLSFTKIDEERDNVTSKKPAALSKPRESPEKSCTIINESRSSSPISESQNSGVQSFYEYSTLKIPPDFAEEPRTKTFTLNPPPPSAEEIKETMSEYGIPQARYPEPFCSRSEDVPLKALEVGGRVLKLKSNLAKDLKEFEGKFQDSGIKNWKMILSVAQSEMMDSSDKVTKMEKFGLFEPVVPPPSRRNVVKWLMENVSHGPVAEGLPILSKRFELPSIEVSPIRIQSQGSPEVLIGRKPREGTKVETLCSTPVNAITSVIKSEGSGKLKRSFSEGDDSISDMKCVKTTVKPRTTKKRRLSFEDDLRRKTLVGQAKKGGKDSSCENSQVEGMTLNNTYGFKVSAQVLANSHSTDEYENLTLLSMELHVRTRDHLCPDPHFDAICAVFYHIKHDVPGTEATTGMIIVEDGKSCCKLDRNIVERTGFTAVGVKTVSREFELIQEFLKLVTECDPDIMLGYEIQMTSWGYLIARAEVLGMQLAAKISRIPEELKGSHLVSDEDEVVSQKSEIYIRGRIMLNVWRIIRGEVTLNSYGFENVAFHVLHRRTAKYSYKKLTEWFDHHTDLHRWKTIKYYVMRAEGNVSLLEKLDVITRTSELAKLFGILFFEVLSRGSQFRVESMMHRLTTTANYITVTPSVQQRASMRAPECVQLILEPESRFYTHPVVVLDFQSLYPSIVIAYNYCFSTCLGRIEHHGKSEPFDFGCTTLKVPPGLLKKLEGKIHYSPTGIAFVTSEVRRGILPQMLDEILSTRIMVKGALKKASGNRRLEKRLDARQLGLKLIANVTYGYTAANFSGRMPCVEVADSILGKARETLERAIGLVETTNKWDAKVVYGDTDSMFILLNGRTKEDAFRIGQEIADAVTATNPWPVRLKLEKVYMPCVLQTKKRYVGFKYESPSQVSPQFEAKGIETVRRDGCPAVVKVLEKSLHILFNTCDVSKVKMYVQKQFTKLLSGRASVQDYVFAREYRGMSLYKLGAHVAALEIAKKRLREDPRAEPRVGERVPYVVVYGSPGLPLIKLIREPQDLLKDPSLRINAQYYVGTVLCAPLQRVFSLLGADVNTWYAELPRVLRAPFSAAVSLVPGASISRYFTVDHCPICDQPAGNGGNVCGTCRKKPQIVAVVIAERARKAERKYAHHQMICKSCTGEICGEEIVCGSLDCQVLFRYHQAKWDCCEATRLRNLQW